MPTINIVPGKRKWVRRQPNLDHLMRVKRKYTKRIKPLQTSFAAATPTLEQMDSDNSSATGALQIATGAEEDDSNSGGGDGGSRDRRPISKPKLFKRNKSSAAANTTGEDRQQYFANFNKVLQDRNKLLLEILEQRTSEIRNLKLRVSSMVKASNAALLASSTATAVDHKTPPPPTAAAATMSSESMVSRPADEREETKKAQPKEGAVDPHWSNVELANAFAMQKQSKHLYGHVQEHFSLPLPAPADIETYLRGLHVTANGSVLMQFLQMIGQDDSMTELDRVTVLQISEWPIETCYEYDFELDEITEPSDVLVVVVAKGLYSNWQQLVLVHSNPLNADAERSSSLQSELNAVIRELHKIKFSVVACVCPYPTTTTTTKTETPSLWSQIGVATDCNYFSHPISDEFIYLFYYVDDLLLMMQTYFLNDKFVMNKKPIERLSDRTIAKSLLESNSISAARKLFSSSTVQLLRCCYPTNDDPEADATAEFLERVSQFYNLLTTSTSSYDNEPSVRPYGQQLEQQNRILNEVQLHFYRCRNATKPDDFQRATMQTIESLKMLQHSTKQRYRRDSFGTSNISREFLRSHIDRHYLDIPPTVLNWLKGIFLPTNEPYKMRTAFDECFYDNEIESHRNESAHVRLLIEWIADKYTDKYPLAVGRTNDEFLREMNKCEKVFLVEQNPVFRCRIGATAQVFEAVQAQTQWMYPDVIRTFVLQRHLLRVMYYNAVGEEGMAQVVDTAAAVEEKSTTLTEEESVDVCAANKNIDVAEILNGGGGDDKVPVPSTTSTTVVVTADDKCGDVTPTPAAVESMIQE